MTKFKLPPEVTALVKARNELKEHYKSTGLKFTLDGNLVGDLGEAIAAKWFGIKLNAKGSTAGIDGTTEDGRSVQVKATGTGRGPAFRQIKTKANHLLFFDLDFENSTGTVVFNGPEHIATESLPKDFVGQRLVSRTKIEEANATVQKEQRIPMIEIKEE